MACALVQYSINKVYDEVGHLRCRYSVELFSFFFKFYRAGVIPPF